MALIAPALFAADFGNLGQALRRLKGSGCRMVHLDAGDGHFSTEITAGQPVLESIRKATDLELDVHLLIEEPERYISEFARAGAHRLAVHPESTLHLYRTLRMIQRAGVKAGVALEPGTSIGGVCELLPTIDFLSILCAERATEPAGPGAEEGEFIEASLDKLRKARRLRDKMGLSFEIEVEGGVGPGNARELAEAGADILVIGSAIFDKDDPAPRLGELYSLTSPLERARSEGSAFSGS
jgi:ribulose-phosphate 3-epimerase